MAIFILILLQPKSSQSPIKVTNGDANQLSLTTVLNGRIVLLAYCVVRNTLDLDHCISFLEEKSIHDFLENLGELDRFLNWVRTPFPFIIQKYSQF